MPAVPRDLSVTYGSFTVGGSTSVLLDSWTRVEDNFVEAAYELSFIVTGSTDALFATACANAEAAFRIPRQDLVVTQAGSTLKSLKQSDNSGLDCDPKIMKQESIADTGRSRRYTVRLDFGRPADNVSTNGLRMSTTLRQTSASFRRRVTVAGVYTAIPTSGTAFSQFLANIDALCVAQLTVIDPNTGTSIFWEEVEEPRAEYNTTNKVLEFSRTYQEKVYPDAGQSTSTMDDPQIVDQIFDVAWVAEGCNDSPGTGIDFASQSGSSGPSTSGNSPYSGTTSPTVVNINPPQNNPGQFSGSTARLGKVIAVYDASINKNLTTDLVTKYNSVIRNWMISEAQKVIASGWSNPVLMQETPNYDRDNNRIHVEMEFWCQGPSHTIEQKITTRMSKPTYGWVLVPRWKGNSLSKYRYQGPAQQLKIVTETRTVIGSPSGSDLGTDPGASDTQVPVSRDQDQTIRTLGMPNLGQFRVTDIVTVTILEMYDGSANNSSVPSTGASQPGNGPSGTIPVNPPPSQSPVITPGH